MTMTSRPPRRLVARGRFPLGLICSEVPSVMDKSAFLGARDVGCRVSPCHLLLEALPDFTLRSDTFPPPLFWGNPPTADLPAGLISESQVPIGQGIFPVQDGVSQLAPARYRVWETHTGVGGREEVGWRSRGALTCRPAAPGLWPRCRADQWA